MCARIGKNPETGKDMLSFKLKASNYDEACKVYGKDNVMFLPCGTCLECRAERARQWSIRCCLESLNYKDICFITLTYNNEHLPKNGSLCKRDFQNFMKRLRFKYGDGIRFFACGEYGMNPLKSSKPRPHYHAIIYNYFPKDAVKFCNGPHGGSIYKSKELSEIWNKGFTEVGDFSINSAGYVARYCTKKYGKQLDYKRLKLTPEFVLMSRKPGLAESYFNSNKDFIYKYDRLFTKFGVFHNLKYFDKKMEQLNPELLDQIKKLRIENADLIKASRFVLKGFSHTEDYIFYDAKKHIKRLEKLVRNSI